MDGSGQLTHRNRRFLKKFIPAKLTVDTKQINLPFIARAKCDDPSRKRAANRVDETGTTTNSLPPVETHHDLVVSTSDLPPAPPCDQVIESVPNKFIELSPPEIPPCNVSNPSPRVTPSPAQRKSRIPLALRRLMDYNSKGLSE